MAIFANKSQHATLLMAIQAAASMAAPTSHKHTIAKRDPSGGRAIKLASYSSIASTTESCTSYCSDYNYFGTEYGEQYFCGNKIASGSSPTTGCSMTCAGDSTQICGGHSKLSLYVNNYYVPPSASATKGWAYQGCHTEACADACSGYLYAGIEYGRECYCGSSLHSGSNASESDCSFLCPGDKRSFYGAGDRLTLYEAVRPTNVSGYGDDVNARLLSSLWSYGDDMTVKRCATVCRQYSYFGLEDGNQCFCGSSFSPTASPVAEIQCARSCPGSTTESCGDTSLISTYASVPLKPPPSSIASVGKFNYKFCSSDAGEARVLARDREGDNDMTVEMCAAFCADYDYFGVEYGVECFCGNVFTGMQQPEDECSYLCPGDGSEFCGAANRINVYEAPVQTITTASA
ncbi:WSC domain-containing protein [Truncatella angustata]|uniref:WSC domain-containing protein n=1 Tax=Truncatella angustata TaxID=152316 RepID=A0A9P8UH59_9PEZI|nr:WSC domain-containing protein [Truncatella angustata]KAH6652040.1 WSC domain-containing protein [Truncatella angustata]